MAECKFTFLAPQQSSKDSEEVHKDAFCINVQET